MSFNQRCKNNQLSSTGNFNTSVAGTAKAGSTIPLGGAPGCAPVSLCFTATMGVTTTSLTMTPSWQVSVDGSTWVDLKPQNGAANVATAAGTGSLVTTTWVLCLPSNLPFRYARGIITNAGATGAAGDTYTVAYHWIQSDGVIA